MESVLRWYGVLTIGGMADTGGMVWRVYCYGTVY